MKNKKFSLFISLVIVIIIIMNYRYPFFTNKSAGWSVGFNTIDSIKIKLDVSLENFITSKSLNQFNKNEESVFLADPFFLRNNDTTFLFVENQIKNDNARIDLFISLDNKKFEYQGVVLDEEFHLSYPQVFKHENKFYMLPETKRSNNVLLYGTDSFPYNWKVCDTLIKNVRFKDPTILILKNKFYLFTVDDDLILFVYTSKSLKGPWKLFKNHTKLKGNETRPAGRIFQNNGTYYLPVQNLREGYGTGVSLYAINIAREKIELKKEYNLFLNKNEKISIFNKGMHHVDIQEIGVDYFSVYDGNKKRIEKMFNWKRTIKYNLIDLNLY